MDEKTFQISLKLGISFALKNIFENFDKRWQWEILLKILTTKGQKDKKLLKIIKFFITFEKMDLNPSRQNVILAPNFLKKYSRKKVVKRINN